MISKLVYLLDKPTYSALAVLFIMHVCVSQSAVADRISYKEDATTGPRRYKDKFAYKKEYNSLYANGSPQAKDRFRVKGCSSYKYNQEGEVPSFVGSAKSANNPGDPKTSARMKLLSLEYPNNLDRLNSNIRLGQPIISDHANSARVEWPNNIDRVKSVRLKESNNLDRVKAVSLGEKTMRQSDDDDDDDDDGGEEEGIGDSENLSGDFPTEDSKKDKVPLVILQGKLDMLAMEIPIKDIPGGVGKERMRTGKSGKMCDEFQQKARSREKEQNDLRGGTGFVPVYKFMP